MRGQSEEVEDEEKPLPLPHRSCRTTPAALPRRCSREGILVLGWTARPFFLSVFPEAMRHLLLPDSLKAPDADTVASPCHE
ncbi:Klotho [Dissostichus eleginoides]|uniref:Klotho n=1 Tax=Dissostichus eleginoides TaxID=100907 RepID=A0AAD9B8W8_DISEL|nr:Klotho [Dissostichus eleginoides]